jgi:hypothetical protein
VPGSCGRPKILASVLSVLSCTTDTEAFLISIIIAFSCGKLKPGPKAGFIYAAFSLAPKAGEAFEM